VIVSTVIAAWSMGEDYHSIPDKFGMPLTAAKEPEQFCSGPSARHISLVKELQFLESKSQI
jgi:hypothetical protein